MDDKYRVAGIILAGGKSRRMGENIDKALCRLGNEMLVVRAYRRLMLQLPETAINSNDKEIISKAFSFENTKKEMIKTLPKKMPICFGDPIAGYVGPLGGILAGMIWAREKGFDWLVSVAVDTPFFPNDLAKKLYAQATDKKVPIVLAASFSKSEKKGEMQKNKIRCHPTFGIWSTALCDDLYDALLGDTRKIIEWSDRHSRETLIFDNEEGEYFFNINRPQDLKKAEEMRPIFEKKGLR